MIKFNFIYRFIIKKIKNFLIKINIFNSSLIAMFHDMFYFFRVSKQRKKIIFLVKFVWLFWQVLYKCRTPTRVGHRDTPHPRGVRAS
jgi:hypothetical protein